MVIRNKKEGKMKKTRLSGRGDTGKSFRTARLDRVFKIYLTALSGKGGMK